MPYPSYNPTLVLRQEVKEQDYPVDPAPALSIANTKYPMGDYPLGDLSGSQMSDPTSPAGPSFEAALNPKGPGDPGVVKYSPYSKDQGF